MTPMDAHTILQKAAKHMQDRASTYDSPDGERSMSATVQAFNAITGRHLTEAEGWLFMALLKAVRGFQRKGYHADSVEDMAAYVALMGEAKAKEMCLVTDRKKMIAEIREALEKATPGPFIARDYEWPGNDKLLYWVMTHDDGIGAFACYEDAHLAANAPEWLRFLLNEIDRLDREYAEERAAHNAHMTELLECELERDSWKAKAEGRGMAVKTLTEDNRKLRYENGGFQ